MAASFYEFVKAFWPAIESAPFVDNWHIRALCDHLQAVTNGQIKKLLINIPPGCSKSLLASVFWPVWEWARDPTVRWFFASYDQRLSTRDSVKCRHLIASALYRQLFGNLFSITHDQNQKTYYETNQGGYRLATSIGGHGTGEHPDRIVVDDPHNVQQAESEVERQGCLDWFDLTMASRGVSRDVRRVVIMQRLHHRDMSAHLLSKGDWVHVCLCMRHEPGRMAPTPLGWTDPRTGEGELLTPGQFSEEQIGELEKSLGPYGVAGQLQQRPQPRGGGMFQESYFNNRPKAAPYNAVRVRGWDRAATFEGGCYTAGVLLAKDPAGQYYVEDVVHGQWEPDERDRRIVAAALRDRARYGPNHEPTILIEHEPGSSGVDAYKNTARKLAGFVVRPDRPTGSKDIRAEPWSSQLAAGNVSIITDGRWDVDGFVQEHVMFRPAPGKRVGKYADQVDASSMAFNYLAKLRPPLGLRSYTLNSGKKGLLKILVVSREGLEALEIEPQHKCLLIHLREPGGEVMEDEVSGVQGAVRQPAVSPTSGQVDMTRGAGRNGEHLPPPPLYGFTCLETLTLFFSSIQPKEVQDKWEEILPGYGKKPEEVIMAQGDGKKIWSLLTKKRPEAADVFIFQADVAEVGLSVAFAVCDILRQPRSGTLYRPEEPESRYNGPPPNEHVFQVTKHARGLVVS